MEISLSNSMDKKNYKLISNKLRSDGFFVLKNF